MSVQDEAPAGTAPGRRGGITRRGMLIGSAAGMAAVAAGGLGAIRATAPAQAADTTVSLHITDGRLKLIDGTFVYILGYGTSATTVSFPGQVINVVQGDTVNVSVTNHLGVDHAFFIDGVVDSGPIAPGATANFSFTAPSAGTYLYFDNLNAPVNRIVGLHGALISMPPGTTNQSYPGGPTFVEQLVWMLVEIDPRWNDAVRTDTPVPPDFVPRYFTTNGRSGAEAINDPTISPTGHIGEPRLIRIVNAGIGTHGIHIHGNHLTVLAVNGQVLDSQPDKDVIPMRPLDRRDCYLPFERPRDAYPPAVLTDVPRNDYVVHDHIQMGATAAGGLYPQGCLMHWDLLS